MDLKVNRQSKPPLHLQPKAQVKHLIRAGRNAPCPCGSGKKSKHCCGA
ncbi:MAG: SEC-C metal-binding domain-containing protein [Candidatus Methylomirabilales bacterium]